MCGTLFNTTTSFRKKKNDIERNELLCFGIHQRLSFSVSSESTPQKQLGSKKREKKSSPFVVYKTWSNICFLLTTNKLERQHTKEKQSFQSQGKSVWITVITATLTGISQLDRGKGLVQRLLCKLLRDCNAASSMNTLQVFPCKAIV